jgi:hypothetical protein
MYRNWLVARMRHGIWAFIIARSAVAIAQAIVRAPDSYQAGRGRGWPRLG